MIDDKLLKKFKESDANLNYRAWWRKNLPDHSSYNIFMNQLHGDTNIQDDVKEAIILYLAK